MAAAVSSLLTLLLAGLVVQVVYRPRGESAGWRSRASPLESNQLGFRGHPIRYDDGDFVVVLLGDSQVEARACGYGWMPERRLEHHLRALGRPARVFSVGAGGYGQDQQLLALREYFQLHRADLVLHWITVLNDVWNNLFPTHWPRNGWRKPTFWLEDGALRGPDLAMGEPVPTASVALLALLQRAFPGDTDGAWARRHLPPAYAPLTDWNGPVDRSWQERWERDAPAGEGEDVAREKSHYAIRLTPPSPRMRHGIELARRLLAEMATLCGEHGARFELLDVPWPELLAEPATVHLQDGRLYRTSGAQMAANVAALTDGFVCHTVPATVDSPRVGPGDVHLNQHAVDQVMRDLCPRLPPAPGAGGR